MLCIFDNVFSSFSSFVFVLVLLTAPTSLDVVLAHILKQCTIIEKCYFTFSVWGQDIESVDVTYKAGIMVSPCSFTSFAHQQLLISSFAREIEMSMTWALS